jgi:CRISPR-associated protein Csd2
VLIFDVKHGNPNGDPDRANAPRVDPYTGRGLVTPVCLKRKVRNYVALRMAGQDGYEIFIEEGAVLADKKAEVVKATKKGQDPTQEMCRRYFDVRACGGLLSANQKAEAKTDSVTGPLQITFSQSVDQVHPQDHTITRCAAENQRENKENKTMGVHYAVPYGVYVAYDFIDPHRAKKTGFSVADLEILKEALANLFENERSTQRGAMSMRAIYAFEHDSVYGTPGANGLELLETVEVRRRAGVDVPQDFNDYETLLPSQDELPQGVTLQVWMEPFRRRVDKAA